MRIPNAPTLSPPLAWARPLTRACALAVAVSLSLTSTATMLSRALLLGGLLVGTLPAPTHAAPPAQFVDARGAQARGRIACRVTENGGAASGTMIVRKISSPCCPPCPAEVV